MQRLTTYMLRQLVTGTVLVTGGLLCIVWLTQSLRFVELIVDKGVSFLSFLQLTGLLLPSLLVIIQPIAVFAVVLFTYNRLNMDRELVVMRAAGIGPWGLAKPALYLAGALTVVGYAFTLDLSPRAVSAFKDMQWVLRHDASQLLLREGTFNNLGEGLTVYVRERGASGELRGLLVHDVRDPKNEVTMTAERGALVSDDDGPRVVMVNGSRQSVDSETKKLSLLYFDSYTMEIGGNGKGGGPRIPEVSERPTAQLLTLQAGDESWIGADEVREMRAAAHQRLTQPLAHITFTLIALATLFSGSFNRRGAGKRVLAAVVLMIATESAMIGAANIARYSLTFLPLIYLATLLPGILAAIVLWRPSVLNLFTFSQARAS